MPADANSYGYKGTVHYKRDSRTRCSTMASESRVARRRRNDQSGFSLGSLLLWVGLIAGLIWTWDWVDKTWIGDADSRIHIYNSLGRNVSLTLAIQKTGDGTSVKTVSLKSGKRLYLRSDPLGPLRCRRDGIQRLAPATVRIRHTAKRRR